jgi:hypothetical protein
MPLKERERERERSTIESHIFNHGFAKEMDKKCARNGCNTSLKKIKPCHSNPQHSNPQPAT